MFFQCFNVHIPPQNTKSLSYKVQVARMHSIFIILHFLELFNALYLMTCHTKAIRWNHFK